MTDQELAAKCEEIKTVYAKAYTIGNINEVAELAVMSMPLINLSNEDYLIEFENCLEAQINN